MTEKHTESNSIHVHNTTPNTSLQTYTHAELPAVLNKSIQEALNFCVAAQLKYKTTKIQLNSHLFKKHTPHITRHTGARKPITCCTQHSRNWCHDVAQTNRSVVGKQRTSRNLLHSCVLLVFSLLHCFLSEEGNS